MNTWLRECQCGVWHHKGLISGVRVDWWSDFCMSASLRVDIWTNIFQNCKIIWKHLTWTVSRWKWRIHMCCCVTAHGDSYLKQDISNWSWLLRDQWVFSRKSAMWLHALSPSSRPSSSVLFLPLCNHLSICLLVNHGMQISTDDTNVLRLLSLITHDTQTHTVSVTLSHSQTGTCERWQNTLTPVHLADTDYGMGLIKHARLIYCMCAAYVYYPECLPSSFSPAFSVHFRVIAPEKVDGTPTLKKRNHLFSKKSFSNRLS